MISRARSRLTGLMAMATLVAVIVGLPVVLADFGGSPLPRHIPSWHHVAAVLTSRDNGTLLLGTVRDISWLAWLLFTLAVLAEVQAAIRGRNAPRLWLGGMQGYAARLVALAALTFTVPSAVTLTASAATVAPAHWADQADTGAVTVSSASASAETVTGTHVITVRQGDCLWTIAQHYLGAGDRYREIVSMNSGHDMGDGQVFGNPSLIQPGWRLELPASPGHDNQPAPGRARHIGHASRDEQFRRQHAGAGHQASGQHATGRHAARPAEDPALRPAAGDSSYQTSADVASSAGAHVPEAAVFGAGALAGAVITSLTRLRRRQRQYRRRGRRIPLPADRDVLATEQRLRAEVPAGPPSTLQDALRHLQSGLTGTGRVLPDIVGLHVTPAVLEVLLAAPALDAPPPPYAISPGRQGMCWQLPLGPADGVVSPAAPTARGSGLLPGLFTAGGTDDGFLLLDLESLQVTGCDGPPELVDQVIAATATELATGQWSGWYDLILVGFDELEVLGRAEHCASVEHALRRLEARCATLRRRLGKDPTANVRELRLTAPEDEDWGLTILISGIEPTPEELLRLLELAEGGPGGIAVLVAGDPETEDGRMAPTVLQLAPDPHEPQNSLANVVPLQVTVRPQVLSEADYQAISTLFTTAVDLDDVSPATAPYEIYGAPPWIPQAAAMGPPEADFADFADETALVEGVGFASAADFAPEGFSSGLDDARPSGQRLEIKILGPFAITGGAGQLQPKQAELVLALALAAPAGLTNSALCSMLGADPDHPKPSDAVRQIITRARRRLGQAADGQEYVIHAGNGTYVLHPDVSLDWTEFRGLVATGRAENMRAALSLIRGQPFTGSYFWWIDIPLLETVRAEIVDAAETLAEFELTTSAARAAARAARAGLAAEASAEQLWRLLMRAEHAAGNLGGVAEAWRRCLDAIEDIAPGGEPHPDTETLYRQLVSMPRQQMPARG
jgi:DNA-binding SARP family transcriptional activator